MGDQWSLNIKHFLYKRNMDGFNLLFFWMVPNNNVLLVKIEGPVWHTIYHHLPIVKVVYYTPLLINQPMGKGHLCIPKCELFHENTKPIVSKHDVTQETTKRQAF